MKRVLVAIVLFEKTPQVNSWCPWVCCFRWVGHQNWVLGNEDLDKYGWRVCGFCLLYARQLNIYLQPGSPSDSTSSHNSPANPLQKRAIPFPGSLGRGRRDSSSPPSMPQVSLWDFMAGWPPVSGLVSLAFLYYIKRARGFIIIILLYNV